MSAEQPGQASAYGAQPYVPTTPLYSDYRPGIVPLRPLVIGDIYGGVTSAIRGNPAATIGLGLLTTLVFVVPATAAGAALARWVQGRLEETGDPELTDLAGTAGGLLPTLAATFAVYVMSAFMAHVIGQGVIGAHTSLDSTWAAAKGRLLPAVLSALAILGLTVLALLLCLGGPILILVAGASSSSNSTLGLGFLAVLAGGLASVALVLFIGTRYALASSAIVLERLGVVGGMRRSWRLTAGSQFWRVFGIRLLTALLAGIGGAILSFPITSGLRLGAEAAGIGPSGMIVAAVFITAISTVVTGSLTTPFTSGTDTLLYIDQRIRREALDVQLVQAARTRTV